MFKGRGNEKANEETKTQKVKIARVSNFLGQNLTRNVKIYSLNYLLCSSSGSTTPLSLEQQNQYQQQSTTNTIEKIKFHQTDYKVGIQSSLHERKHYCLK